MAWADCLKEFDIGGVEDADEHCILWLRDKYRMAPAPLRKSAQQQNGCGLLAYEMVQRSIVLYNIFPVFLARGNVMTHENMWKRMWLQTEEEYDTHDDPAVEMKCVEIIIIIDLGGSVG